MVFKSNFFTIPATVIVVSLLGSLATSSGMSWYNQLSSPRIAPPGGVIGLVWTILFMLIAVAVLVFWNSPTRSRNFYLILGLLIANGLLNILWCVLFFALHSPAGALVEIFVLNFTIVFLIALFWRSSLWSAILFIPYFLWVSFATYLNYLFWRLN
jgi:tryptophan-rich sensory protein